MRALEILVVTFIIAFVLGRLWEPPLTQAVILTGQDPLQLANYPVALLIIALGIGLVLYAAFVRPRR